MTTTKAAPAFPQELIAVPRFLVWKAEPGPDGRTTKIPYDAETGGRASSTDAATWTSFEVASAALEPGGYSGLGFALGDGFAGVDLDHCVRDGSLEPWAARIIERLRSYAELSPSGTGVHIIVRASLPPGLRRAAAIEMYDGGRFFTLTGLYLPQSPAKVEARQDELASLHAEVTDLHGFTEWTRRRGGGWEKIRRLLEGDASEYGGDDSRADLALVSHLARYAGGDADRIDRLFRLTRLYRGKWDDPRGATTYGALTIAKAAESAPEGFHLTDLGNAERLADRHGDDLRFARSQGWFWWDGRRWARDETGEILRRAKATVRNVYAEAAEASNDNERKAIAAHAVRSESESAIRKMIALAESESGIAVTVRDLDVDPWLLTVSNGTLDLRTGALRPHRREDLIAKIAPVEFDPAASSTLWDRVLAEALPDPEVRAFFQRVIGYGLTGDIREDKLFLVHGPTATGKSTILEAIKATFGDYAQTADFETFLKRRDAGGVRNDIAKLAGARLVLSIEVDEGRRLAEGLVKGLTGGDTISARFLYHESFEFRPQFKLMLAANHAPRVPDDDDALWRRIVRIPFDSVIPKNRRDLKIKPTLRDPSVAGAAILAWAVRGCVEWQARGLAIPPQIEAATQSYRAEMDPIGRFLNECCLLGPQYWASAKELRLTFEQWAEENGEHLPITGRAFGDRLRAHGFEPERRGSEQTRGWKGVGLMTGRQIDGLDSKVGNSPRARG